MSVDHAAMINARRGGFNEALGLVIERATAEEVVATVTLGAHHHQPYGVVHGGVYCAMIETVASIGAAVNVMPEGRHTVGLENSTTFLRATREGTLTARGTPLTRGRRSHVWEVEITDGAGRLVAKGRVRMLVLEGDATLAGEAVTVKAR